MNNKTIKNIPTNIILGFLGSGKTTAILHLIKQKPQHEIWAIWVNEFGNIGIDQDILKQHNIVIYQQSGGCMCCTGTITLQVKLTQFIRKTQPDRLIIEPSGLAHPAQLMNALLDVDLQQIIQLDQILCLIDLPRIAENTYISHELIQQQLALSDLVVFNKTDLASLSLQKKAQQLIQIQTDKFVSFGKIPLAWLAGKSQQKAMYKAALVTTNYQKLSIEINKDTQFSLELFTWLKSQKIERCKAKIHSKDGWKIINQSKQQQMVYKTYPQSSNVFEFISEHALDEVSVRSRIMGYVETEPVLSLQFIS